MRETTKRLEAIKPRTLKLVVTYASRIVSELTELLDDAQKYQSIDKAHGKYGDEQAAQRIVKVLQGKSNE